MSVDHFRYDLLAQEALRGVVRRVLTATAKNGLPGEHHFYVTFDTRAPGLKISPRLAAQHPQEMTIVLQHQFWDLTVADESFEVGLSFKGIPERLVVPFAAIKGFFDPSVQFGLQFATDGESQEKLAAAPTPASPPSSEPVPSLPARAGTGPDQLEPPAAATEAAAAAETPAPAASGEIVRLDRFRKK
jgi:hypothetical protein